MALSWRMPRRVLYHGHESALWSMVPPPQPYGWRSCRGNPWWLGTRYGLAMALTWGDMPMTTVPWHFLENVKACASQYCPEQQQGKQTLKQSTT